MKVIGYKVFNSTEEFEQWQKDNTMTFHVINVVPLPQTFEMTETNAVVNCGVFVTYYYEPADKD